jgi:hypothetical protein
MTDERRDAGAAGHVDEALDDLRRALAIDPSPEFAVRVRARVHDERARGWRWRGSRAWLIALVPAAAAVVLALQVLPNQTPTTPARPVASEPPRADLARTDTPAIPGREPAASAPATRAVPPNRTSSRAVMTAAAATTRREPEVIIPDDQRVALMRLLAALREGSAIVPPGAPIVDELTGELLEPTPIELLPITVEPLPGTPPEGGSGKR